MSNNQCVLGNMPEGITEERIWWVVQEFVPHADNLLAVSVGLFQPDYEHSPRRHPGYCLINGTISIIKLKDEDIGMTLSID